MNNRAFSITSQECESIEKEREDATIVNNLRKALSKVGDVNISEAIRTLSENNRFIDSSKSTPYWKSYSISEYN